MIELIGLSKTYSDGEKELIVINDLTIAFSKAEMIAIMGESGVGKSTLLYLIAGLEKATKGKVMIDNQDILSLNDKEQARFRLNNIGFVFQFHHLLPDFTAIENIALPAILAGRSQREARNKAEEMLDYLGLIDKRENYPSQLSGGQRQRVALARAVINNPKIILADEPTGSLDLDTSREVIELLMNLTKEIKSLVILATHSLTIAKKASTILSMENGGYLKELSKLDENK